MASLRNGTYGKYYGSTYNESEPLSSNEQIKNAEYIYSFLTAKGWTLNAIAALLGNMQAESSINPGRWQSEDVGNVSLGYGLVQWTPATKFTEWCVANGYDDPSTMDANLSRIVYEVNNNLQWIATVSYNLSFEEFSTSNSSVDYLAKAFLLNYERPKDQSASVQALRASFAQSWYDYLTGTTPTPPTGGDNENISTKRTKKKYKFLIFNARNRRREWTR